MSEYPEIAALNKIYITHKVEVRFSSTDFLDRNEEYPAVEFRLGEKEFNFYASDEQGDKEFNYPLLNLCLVLRELENYIESTDYLIWCKENYLDPNDTGVLAHFRNLGTIYREVEKIIGKIESHISDWDFEMGSGASWELRKQGLT